MKLSNLLESIHTLLNEEECDMARDLNRVHGWSKGAANKEADRWYANNRKKTCTIPKNSASSTPQQKYNLEIDGKIWKKDGVAVVFDSEAHAKAVANKPWAKNKKVVPVPVK